MIKQRMRKMRYAISGATIIAQAPCRADLAGGTIDLWPLYLFHPGALTLNFAVNILTTCRITPLRGREMILRSLDTGREQHFASFEQLRLRVLHGSGVTYQEQLRVEHLSQQKCV